MPAHTIIKIWSRQSKQRWVYKLLMEHQVILAVDNQGNFLGYISKEVGHKGLGKRHRAITVLVYNSKGQVLLQKRKHKIFDNIWDFTGATHPLHKESYDETLEEAASRCLEVEYGITDKVSFKNLGFFNYSAKDGENSENEHCALIVGEYNGEVNLNPKVGYEYKWMDQKEFLVDIKAHPKSYAPWVIEGVKILNKQ